MQPAQPVQPKGKLARKARADFNAKKAKVLKPLETKIKSLENEIIASEERVKEVNEEMAQASKRGSLGALQRSEFSRELKDLAEKIDSCYVELDVTMKTYDSEKRKCGI